MPTSTVRAFQANNQGANVTSHSMAMPTHVAGDALLAFIRIGTQTNVQDNNGADSPVTRGWTVIATDTSIASTTVKLYGKIAASASEVAIIPTSATAKSAGFVVSIQDHGCKVIGEAVTASFANGSSTTPDPPSVANFPHADLFLTLMSFSTGASSGLSTYPASYASNNNWHTDNGDQTAAGSSMGVALAARAAVLPTPVDPGTFGISGTAKSWVATTIAIRAGFGPSVGVTIDSGTSATSHNLNMPAFVGLGDQLLAIVRISQLQPTTFTLGTGWTATAGASTKNRYYTKIATSTEVALAGSTVTLTLGTSASVAANIYAVRGALDSTPDVSTEVTGSDNTANFNTVTVTGGAQEACIIAGLMEITDGTSGVPVTTPGSDSWDGVTNTSSTATGASGVASAYKMTTGASYSPTIWTLAGAATGRAWSDFVFAVRRSAALVKKLKLLVHSSAVGSTVDGAVFSAPTGGAGQKVCGNTKYGEFTGVAFAAGAGADAEFAVVKVPIADFGGSGLGTGTSLAVICQDADESTPVCIGTVIEE